MDVHRFELAWFATSLVLIAGFIATIAYGSVGAGVAMVDDSGGTIDPSTVTEEGSPFADPGVEAGPDDGYVVHVVARQFQFLPGSSDPITVPADAEVTFRVTTPDVVHGFSIVGTNVNTMVIPGQISEMTVSFDETGTYGLVCHEYCGAGHHTMGGTVEVVPQSEFSVGGAAPGSGDQAGTATGGTATPTPGTATEAGATPANGNETDANATGSLGEVSA